jgi:hypothetical protein
MRQLTSEELSLIAEGFRDGRPVFAGRTEADAPLPPMTRDTVTFGPRVAKPQHHVRQADRLADGAARLGRWQRGSTRRQRPQSRRAVRSGDSRDGPLPSDDDPHESDDLTALQRAQLLLLEALCVAAEDGRRTYEAFLDLTANRVASEITRLTDWSAR